MLCMLSLLPAVPLCMQSGTRHRQRPARSFLFSSFRCHHESSSGAHSRFLRLLDNSPVKQVNGAFGEIRVTLVVRNHADGCPLALQIPHHLHTSSPILHAPASVRPPTH